VIHRGTFVDRIVWILLAGVAIAVIVTARILPPDPIHGSSAHLGMPPCGFQVFTGYKCPGCGLTTCFAYMTRLDLVGAGHANAFGILLFTCTALFVPLALVSAWRGFSVTSTLDRIHGEKLIIALAILCFLNWAIRFAFELHAASGA
jgi:hypothetical protein